MKLPIREKTHLKHSFSALLGLCMVPTLPGPSASGITTPSLAPTPTAPTCRAACARPAAARQDQASSLDPAEEDK